MSSQVGVVGPGTLNEQVKREQILATVELTATGTTLSVDGLNKGTMVFGFNIGVVTGASPTFDAILQESVDDSVWTAAAATGMFTGAGVAIAQKTAAAFFQLVVDTRKLARYKRISYTITGTTPVFPTAIEVISHPLDRNPVS